MLQLHSVFPLNLILEKPFLISQRNCSSFRRVHAQWEQPHSVPECLVSSLETVEWIGYKGTEVEKQVAVYILEKAIHLKKMTLSRKITSLREKYRTLIDLASRLSCSSKNRLKFVPLEQHWYNILMDFCLFSFLIYH